MFALRVFQLGDAICEGFELDVKIAQRSVVGAHAGFERAGPLLKLGEQPDFSDLDLLAYGGEGGQALDLPARLVST